MPRLLLSISPGEIWAVVVEGNEPRALRVARTAATARPGDLYLGRVVALRPDMAAAFVDIGAARPAFLGEEAGLREGEAVIVRVTRAARADKAVGVTLRLTAAERQHAVLPSQAAAPLLLHRPETALGGLLREWSAPDLDEIVVDDSAALAEARARAGGKVRLYSGLMPLFEEEGVAATIETALARRVVLPGGGALTIEPTAAAIMIDVDGSRSGALESNRASVAEIARQIRLRDLSGPIVIDFIGMRHYRQRGQIGEALAEALGDPEAQYLGWTRLGHFELVRKRHRPSLTELLFDATGQKTPLTVALEALRQAQRESRTAPGRHLALRVHPEIAACFDGVAREAKQDLDRRLLYTIQVVAEPRPRDSVAIVPVVTIS